MMSHRIGSSYPWNHGLNRSADVQSTMALTRRAVSVFFAGLRVSVLGFYFVARGLTRQSRTSAAVHGGTLAIGMALVATQLVLRMQGAKLLPTEIIGFGWALLA